MTEQRTIQRALIGKEDLLLGSGSVTQTRNGASVPIEKINISHIPYEGNILGIDLVNTKEVIQAPIKRGVYDFSTLGGAIGDIPLLFIPDNSTVIKAWYEVITPFTSAGLALVNLGVEVDDVEGLVAIKAFDNAQYLAGYHGCNPNGDVGDFTTKTTDKRYINLTIADAALTAGKLYVWCQYITSE